VFGLFDIVDMCEPRACKKVEGFVEPGDRLGEALPSYRKVSS
jgi:hypothetical protein